MCIRDRTYPAEFPKQNHTLLRDLLLKYPGYAIISYNNCPLAWELYRKDFFIFSLVRENPLKKERGAIYKELIITNYDPRPLMDPVSYTHLKWDSARKRQERASCA